VKALQLWGLLALTGLALTLLYLIGSTFSIIGSHIGPDGRVPSAEAFGLTALLLSFREVVAAIKGIFESEVRTNLTDKLARSTPGAEPPVPADVKDAAQQTADAAQNVADQIEKQP
jgi:hypothetical protein